MGRGAKRMGDVVGLAEESERIEQRRARRGKEAAKRH